MTLDIFKKKKKNHAENSTTLVTIKNPQCFLFLSVDSYQPSLTQALTTTANASCMNTSLKFCVSPEENSLKPNKRNGITLFINEPTATSTTGDVDILVVIVFANFYPILSSFTIVVTHGETSSDALLFKNGFTPHNKLKEPFINEDVYTI